MTEAMLETAWAAGLYEGEGSVSFGYHRASSRRNSNLTLSMTDEDTVRRFARWAEGGNVGIRCKQDRKTAYVFRCTHRRHVRRILVRMMPFLMARRLERAALIADYLSDSIQMRNGRGEGERVSGRIQKNGVRTRRSV